MEEKFIHKKSLGQHFLTSDIVPGWMCDAAEIIAGDKVLEIGPGTGILTKELLHRGASVIALEADNRAITTLEESLSDEITSNKLVIYHTDVRNLDLKAIPELKDEPYKVVANIPYYLSGFLFRTLLSSPLQPGTLVFLVQKEVAKRATSSLAKGQKESLLSLSVKVYGEATYIRDVGRGHFVPPPAVDSGIVAITNINRDNFKNLNEGNFFQLLHLGFGQKRKQLLGNLAKNYDRSELINTFSTIGLSETVRAEDVPLAKWLKLAKALENHS